MGGNSDRTLYRTVLVPLYNALVLLLYSVYARDPGTPLWRPVSGCEAEERRPELRRHFEQFHSLEHQKQTSSDSYKSGV